MSPWRFEDDEDDLMDPFLSTETERVARRDTFRRATTESLLEMLSYSRDRLARMEEMELPDFVLLEERRLIADRVLILRERGVL